MNVRSYFLLGLVACGLTPYGWAQEATNGVAEVPPFETTLELEPAPPMTPIRVMPELPAVDPALRRLYLGEQGSQLGQPKGPRKFKTAKGERTERSWRNELEVGATGYRGNSDSDLFLLKLQSERKTEVSRLGLGAHGNFGNSEGERNRQNAGADASYRHDLGGRYYYAAELRYYYDGLAELDYQVLGLLSLGYDLVKSERTVFSLESGPAYIVEKKGDARKDFLAVRLAESLEHMLNERVLLWERAEFLPALNDASVYLVMAEVGVESVLSAWLRFRTALQYRYDSNPADDKEQADYFLAASLVAVY